MLTPDYIAVIEAEWKLPYRARPLADYKRYYAIDGRDGTPVLVGVHVQSAAGQGIYPVDLEGLPRIFDGGCSIIKLRYALATSTLLSISCNGHA